MSVSDFKVLGIFGVVDHGSLSYKVLAIEANEAKERRIRNLQDYKSSNIGELEEIMNWFLDYKTREGEKKNTFTWQGKVLGPERAIEIIHEQHRSYQAFFEFPEHPEHEVY